MNIFEVGSLYEAVQMADDFRKEGRYDWFRGQQEVLPPTPTYLRLDEKEVGDAKERLRHYCNWMSNTPGLESLSRNIDGAIAVAQHYGLPTSFLDFTKNPAVAGYFASTAATKFKPKTACIYCLNTKKLAKCWTMMRAALPHHPDIEFIELDVPNLWRIEAQEGVFLLCPLNWDKWYPMDRIEFPLGRRLSYPTNDQIYPERKSPLEELLDHHFYAERLGDFERLCAEMFPDAEVCYVRGPDCGYHSEYFVGGSLSKRRDWAKSRLKPWLNVPEENLHKVAVGEIALKVDCKLNPNDMRRAVAYGVLQSIESQPSLRERAVRWNLEPRKFETKRFRRALDRVWNGLRRLPYSNAEISEAIGLCFALYNLNFHKADGFEEQIPIAEVCLGECFAVEISTWNGSYSRAIVAQSELTDALRNDYRKRIRQEYRSDLNGARELLHYCWQPDRLFDFSSFCRLMALQMVPTQVLMSELGPDHFSPARIKGFGIP